MESTDYDVRNFTSSLRYIFGKPIGTIRSHLVQRNVSEKFHHHPEPSAQNMSSNTTSEFSRALYNILTLLSQTNDTANIELDYSDPPYGSNCSDYYNVTPQWWLGMNISGNRGGGVAHQSTPEEVGINVDDAAWVLTATFIIFTMQSGGIQICFALNLLKVTRKYH